MPVHLEQTGKSDALVCPVKVIDLAPLKETVSRFVDFDRLKRRNEGLIHNSSDTPRLIMTSTDIQRGEAVVFDNNRTDIERDQIIACVGFPFYGISWTKIADRYLWDGSLLSNTPLGGNRCISRIR